MLLFFSCESPLPLSACLLLSHISFAFFSSFPWSVILFLLRPSCAVLASLDAFSLAIMFFLTLGTNCDFITSVCGIAQSSACYESSAGAGKAVSMCSAVGCWDPAVLHHAEALSRFSSSSRLYSSKISHPFSFILML